MTVTDSAALTATEFDHLFDTFTATVARMETLPAYRVGGAEAQRLAAFHAGMARPLRSVRTDPWLARIAVTTTQGKRWSRIRVVDTPMTSYQRYQLASHVEAQACGEEVSIAARGDAPDALDVWLFDQGLETEQAVLMHYLPDGSLARRELVVGEPVKEFAALLERAYRKAVPLNEFLAGLDG